MNLPISSMTMAERLEAMDQLWASMRSQPDYAPPTWHAEILAKRQRKIEQGETTFSSLDDVRDRIDRARG